jgi:hypothetical protein
LNFIPLKLVLQKVLAEKRMAGKFTAAQICTVAEKLFLAELPSLTGKFTVKFVKTGTMHIAVISSSLAAEMRMAESTVLDLLNKRKAKIKAVRYEVGKLPEKVLPY